MAPQEITQASQWKKPQGEPLTLPSGNTCLVKRPGMEKLLNAGVLPDNLTPIAMEAVKAAEIGPQDHKKPKGENEVDKELMEKFLAEEGAIEGIFAAFDKVTAMCVIQPPVRYHMKEIPSESVPSSWVEIPQEERDENFLYTDDVDQEDKIFIFNFVVGGTRDLERFRKEHGDAVATLQPVEDVELPSL